ncbi:uncharacterized protein LOC111876970 [Lactuca sativa]|uniref:DUF7806 domain-containing protein n=1 Tax=Lactuca sativa TaxID=4236 RepID=A0A9R1WBD9_LACSA|nr:uncharacterized protein LOC111876970 [Lactuca sativa]XP_023729294.1 uncharacterized protein LOC111876970 [Lactuca sativa]KAJ0220619.1 hypothetical protein LSAT_V11C200060640 [Lactuca sativa]
MEALYSKLYEKYTRVKTHKASEIEHYNFDQEQKFKTYVSAADELIDHLQNEKDTLDAQVNELRNELASIRSAKDEEQKKYEHMLLKENLKIKELSEELERMNRREFHSNTNNEIVPIKQMSTSPLSSIKTNKSSMRKRLRSSIDEHENTSQEESQNDLVKENMFLGAIDDVNQPKCCRRRLGNSVNGSDPSMCMFQELVESLLDLKFSVSTQNDDTLMTAVHDSSGYTFNLGYVKNALGEEELMYKVSSLGTFERVAPEWMREVMLFSKSMSRIFFKKVSAIMKLQE